MAISTIPNLENTNTQASIEQENPSSYCTLTWRRGKLLVKQKGSFRQPHLPATNDKASLIECLKHSPINLVLIDPELGFLKVKLWADAVQKAGKSTYLSIPSIDTAKQSSLTWLQAILNVLVAFVMLVVLIPVVLWLTILMRANSSNSLFTREWHVGKRGKLFQIIKFRTTSVTKDVVSDLTYQNNLLSSLDANYTLIGAWMHKYGFDNIPQLLNVLRGEMNLFGRQSIKLEEAVKLNQEKLKQLNKAPGIFALRQGITVSKLLRLDSQTL